MSNDPIIQLQPHDNYNRDLESNVHPVDWTNPTPKGDYHLVVIGAGAAGLITSAGAAGLGSRVAIIERELMGGDCLNVGCVPSKGIIGAARVAATVRDSAAFGVRLSQPHEFDFAKAMERMRAKRARISPADSAKKFSDLGVDVFLGDGTFVDENRIKVIRKTDRQPSFVLRRRLSQRGLVQQLHPFRDWRMLII